MIFDRVGCSIAGGVVFLILLAIVLVAKREVKFQLYLHFGVKFEDPVDRVTDPNELDYDAFVSYQ